MKLKNTIFLLFFLTTIPSLLAQDSLRLQMVDSTRIYDLEELVVQAKGEQAGRITKQSMQVDILPTQTLTQMQVNAPKDIALAIPNLTMPDYGSAMTSSIYVRGMGSRIDQPVLGLLIDGVPVLDKNAYDISLYDLRRVTLLRGPQGTMYGRNTMGGILQLHTLLPLDLAQQEIRAEIGYGAANSCLAKASVYRHESQHWGWSIAAQYKRTDGFYRNDYKHQQVDTTRRERTSCL